MSVLAAPAGQGLNSADRVYLRRAFRLAGRALAATNPNPRVGCVLVRDGKIQAEAFHRACGQAHAEQEAVQRAGALAEGATAYISLEPCCHHGKTPPCTDALLEHGIARVVYGVNDINPLVSGRGGEILRRARVEVVCAQWQREHLLLNPGYECALRLNRPWLRVKLALSIDGRIALGDGRSQWISNERSRADNQYWRARSDAVVSTWRTVMNDDARLNVRSARYRNSQPTRVILDRSLRCRPSAAIFSADPASVWLLCRRDAGNAERIAGEWAPLCEQGLRIVPLEETDADPRSFLDRSLQALCQHGLREIQVEAGGRFVDFLLTNELVDELLLYQSPRLIGAGRSFYQARSQALEQCPLWRLVSTRRIRDDLRLQYLHPRWDTLARSEDV